MGSALAIIFVLSFGAIGAVPGTADNKQGKCPQGRNIHKLDWDCLLEMEAQKVVDECKIDAKAPDALSMLIEKVPLTTCNPAPLFKKTVTAWWSAVTQQGIGSNALFDNEKLRSFATLAHGKTTRIGCAQKNCNGDLYMACMVYEKGPEMGQPIYELGKGCSSANDCTTYVGSKCKDSLCVGGYIDPTKTTVTTTSATTLPTERPSSPTLTSAPSPTSSTYFPILNKMCGKAFEKISNDEIRMTFLNQHNDIRRRVAEGRVRMSNGKMTRKATKMRKLKYDCSLEMSAYKSAKRCEDTVGNTTVAENRKIYNKISSNFALTAEQVVFYDWFQNEITRNGGHMKQQTGSQNLFLPKLGIPNFAKMVWDSHEKIGCVVHVCTRKNFTNVVCHYSPKGAKYGNTIYTMGPTCNQCKLISATCEDGLCV
ncbi:hypothetical protein Aduo_017356 [Ancylostoma duodenale]